jgi:hypothetical protein
VRERLDVRSAGSLAIGDKGALAEIAAQEKTLAGSEQLDLQRVQQAYTGAAARLKVTLALVPVLSAAEQAAAKLVPAKKAGAPAPAGGGGGGGGGGGRGGGAGAPPALAGYYAMEARNFVDGTRSVLDIRNALAAEFGPVSVDDVVRFFRDAERAGTHTIAEKK